MSKIRLSINGKTVYGYEGQTILQVANENGIRIPTLCDDRRVEIYASCGICTVEAKGMAKLLRACSTIASHGMEIHTDTDKVLRNRKAALELLMSAHDGDCVAPCKLACPAKTDCQGYVGLIANGRYKEAVELIKDKIPFPASIGRICPHPCEDACRRELVEEPISIAALKGFVGDLNIGDESPYFSEAKPSTGKTACIIGGGPGGLTTALKLRQAGHAVHVYDAMPQMGGMLRYGIPEYRLPKRILDAEILAIKKTGIEFFNNIKIGRDLTLDNLKSRYDAVVVAAGAWASTGLRCKGEEMDGVVGGIDFLRAVQLGGPIKLGANVAIVGGGNTAMDACRTAVRLGAKNVYNVYRRTRNEMPAEEIEIVEAEEEGVIFKYLTNPIEVIGKDGKVSSMRLQIMELGEPDASGRRAPVAVEGKEETIEVDTVIAAIGQRASLSGFEELKTTKWGTVVADEKTYMTSTEGVFAVGEAANDGPDIAVTAIGHGLKASEMIDKFLRGEELASTNPYLSKSEKTHDDFVNEEKASRLKMPHRNPDIRRHDFLSVNLPFTAEDAKKEANRCLECGCHDFYECKFLEYTKAFELAPEKYETELEKRMPITSHEFIRIEQGKCILCGLCVRICSEVVGTGTLGLVGRGVDTVVTPSLQRPLEKTDCISCGQCVHVCPTGTLTEKSLQGKIIPGNETSVNSVCPECGLGCELELRVIGNSVIRSLPVNSESLLCVNGRFKPGGINYGERPLATRIRGEDAGFDDAIVYAGKKLQSIQSQHGQDSVAVAVSGKLTNEEAELALKYAKQVLGTDNVFSPRLGKDAKIANHAASIHDVFGAGCIVAVNPRFIAENHATAAMRIRQAVNKGAKLVLVDGKQEIKNEGSKPVFVNEKESLLHDIADTCIDTVYDLEKANIGENAVFIYPATMESFGNFNEVVELLRASSNGRVIELLPEANSRGIRELGVTSMVDFEHKLVSGEIKGLFVFGDLTGICTENLEFLALQSINENEKADVFFPAATFAETDGTYTDSFGNTKFLKKAVDSPAICGYSRTLRELLRQAGL